MNASMASRPTESFALDATRLRSDAIDAKRRTDTRDTQVRILAFDGASNADYIFSVTNAVVMTYFALEILANCTVHYDSYFFGVYYIPVLCAGFYFFGGFYFWLDVISTASMIFDVHWLDVLACVEIKVLRRVRPPRHRRAACSSTRRTG